MRVRHTKGWLVDEARRHRSGGEADATRSPKARGRGEENAVRVTHSRGVVMRFDAAARRVTRALASFRRAVALGDADQIFRHALAVGRALRMQAEVAHAPVASWLIH